MDNFYQIGEFAKAVGKHVNTVDGWFKSLEEKRLHYVNRVAGAKVYDDTDLKIALFIRDKRDEKWAIDGIFDVLPEHFELRPFPIDDTTSVPQVADMEAVMREVRSIAKAMAEEMAASQVAQFKQEFMKLLPEPVDPRLEKEKRVNDIITQRRIMLQLRQEALEEWSIKPKEERMKPAGLFRKVEDIEKREGFVNWYINFYFEERLSKAYGLDY